MAGKSFLLALAVAANAMASPVAEEARIHARQNQQWSSPPVYPAPKGGWLPDWTASYDKAKALVSQMTLAEKVNITTAIGFENGLVVHFTK